MAPSNLIQERRNTIAKKNYLILLFSSTPRGFSSKCNSLKEQPPFRGATKGFPAKWRLRNDYADLGSASCSMKQNFNQSDLGSETSSVSCRTLRYGNSVLVSQTSFPRETSVGVVKCWLFSQVTTATSCGLCLVLFVDLILREGILARSH